MLFYFSIYDIFIFFFIQSRNLSKHVYTLKNFVWRSNLRSPTQVKEYISWTTSTCSRSFFFHPYPTSSRHNNNSKRDSAAFFLFSFLLPSLFFFLVQMVEMSITYLASSESLSSSQASSLEHNYLESHLKWTLACDYARFHSGRKKKYMMGIWWWWSWWHSESKHNSVKREFSTFPLPLCNTILHDLSRRLLNMQKKKPREENQNNIVK